MSSAPLVSVIVPFLNGERFFADAIESVLQQTYGSWELLLIDDGSVDGSTAVARGYAKRFPGRVRYLEHPGHANRGATTSRNLGIRHARGELVAPLDADDVWLPIKLEAQTHLMLAHPRADVVYGTPLYWSSWDGSTAEAGADHVPSPGVLTDTLIEPPSLLTLAYPLGPSWAPCPSDLLCRRELLRRIGGFEEAFQGPLQLYEDQALLAKVYLHGRVFVGGACWTKYRLHPDSCVSRVRREGGHLAARRYYLEWLEAYLRREGVTDRRIWRALRRALRPYRRPTMDRLLRGWRHLIRNRFTRRAGRLLSRWDD